ncbi:MAG: hypothetical protein JW719_01290 [Pirellulales bacterium]|nr:hypothetical protein [Pirellulales bacterium]
MTAIASLPTFQSRVDEIAAAERNGGWLASCIDAERYFIPCRELAAALAECLRALGKGPLLEVCAGRGELAEALAGRDVRLTATDANPPIGSGVLTLSAQAALQRFRPTVVLGCFVPCDARVDEAVLAWPDVRHYLVLGARVGGELASARLWRTPGWTCRSLPQVARWMLTRHDLWMDDASRPIVQHGEAWCFSRQETCTGNILQAERRS